MCYFSCKPFILCFVFIRSEGKYIGLRVFDVGKVPKPLSFQVPLIPPSLSYKLETKVEEVIKEGVESDNLPVEGEKGNCKVIRVFVTRDQMSIPVLAATINMPPTELIV